MRDQKIIKTNEKVIGRNCTTCCLAEGQLHLPNPCILIRQGSFTRLPTAGRLIFDKIIIRGKTSRHKIELMSLSQ